MIAVSLLLSFAHASDPHSVWSPPCSVPVQEEVDKGEGAVTLRYVVHVDTLEGGRMSMTLGSFSLVSIAGAEIDEAQRAELTEALGGLGTLPPAIISPQGELAGIATDTRTLRDLLGRIGIHKQQQRSLQKMFRSDELVALMAADAAHLWWAWTGAWLGDLPEVGGSRQTRVDYASADGRHGPVDATISRDADVDGAPHLIAQLVVPPERLMMEWMLLLGEGAVGDPAARPGRVMRAEATLGADRRPLHTRLELHDQLTSGQRHLEYRDTTWLWAEAQGCGAASAP